ncbi:MAG: gliding motility-associated C-terminal domain-containing protein [Crocinitomicaceae bacterium]|nr:gliding motility-associated C-terminal domain-containing protein [Crocinitomicaceae bacterium]
MKNLLLSLLVLNTLFTFSQCVDPNVPVITTSSSVICPGSNSTLTWTGNLNDATAWHIYTTSCAGTQLATTSSNTLVVSPGVTTTYYIRGEDGAGCVDETSGLCGAISITVDDIAPPTAVCQDIDVYLSGTGDVTLAATDIDNGSFDNCGNVTLSIPPTTFTCTNLGQNNVTLTVADENGNSTDCTATVTVLDTISPTVSCPVNVVVNNDPGVCSAASVALGNVTTGDNCSPLTVMNTSMINYPSGVTNVIWTVTDIGGNSSQCVQTVTVIDTEAPVPDLATLADVTAECEVTALTDPTATDLCGAVITTHDAILPITSLGTTVVTWTYTDESGNASTQTQNIVITDITAPVADIATLADVTAECEATALIAPTATDNCGGIVTVSNDVTLPISTQGTTIVTWTYTDASGNASTQTQNIVIDDVTAPVADIATLADVTAECEVTALTDPTATDNCGGIVAVSSDATLPISIQGTTILTWTYDDGNGNTSTQTQNVIIDDITAPVADIATLADVTAECEVTALTDPTATDNCNGVVAVTNDATLPISIQGTTIVTWTYDDGNGNTSTQTQNIVIDDVTAPVADIATLVDVTAECEVTALTDPTATDNCGGIVTVSNDVTLPFSTQGTTVVTWTYTDENGNASTQTQNIVIDDVTAPVADIATLADITTECEITALIAPTATDNCGGIVTVTNDATLPISIQGTTIVTWTYDDGNGNTSTQTQNVVITDITAPVALCQNINAYLNGVGTVSITGIDLNNGSTDNCGTVNFSASTTDFTCADIGTNNITLTVDDLNGNSATCIATVTVIDTVAPIITCPIDVLVSNDPGLCSASGVVLGAPVTGDNCTVYSITNNSLTTYPVGVTIVTWTVTDINGNVSLCTQTVTVDDMTPPVLPIINDITVECGITVPVPVAMDNCTGLAIGITTDPLTYTSQGAFVINWAFDDGNGNVATHAQNVIIDDVTAPIANTTTLNDVSSACEVTAITVPNATDNCIGLVLGTTTTTFPITTQGTTIVTWTYDDGNGNTSTQTQNVIITDVTAPVADISTLSDITSTCQVVSLSPPSASDNCNGTILGTTTATLPITAQGTTTITWTYDDGNGNTSTQTQNIIIDDPITPVVDLIDLPDITAECSVTSLTAPTATDNCAGSITGFHDAILPISFQGTTVVTWTYDDGNGNLETQVQEVIINDISAPVPDDIVLTDIVAECSLNTLTEPTATDNCGGAVTVTNDANLPFTTIGTHVVTWVYTDGVGNSSAQLQNVIIQDVTAPVVDLSTVAPIVVDCELLNLTTPTATDNCGGDVTITSDAQLPMIIPGSYTITWTFTDDQGNTTTETQGVTINLIEACLGLVTVNDVITPNGDDVNDYWVLENLSYTEGCNVKIFNRWGAQIFETENYDNTWNGTSISGELLPEGVYYYIIQCYDNVSFKGYITIIR